MMVFDVSPDIYGEKGRKFSVKAIIMKALDSDFLVMKSAEVMLAMPHCSSRQDLKYSASSMFESLRNSKPLF